VACVLIHYQQPEPCMAHAPWSAPRSVGATDQPTRARLSKRCASASAAQGRRRPAVLRARVRGLAEACRTSECRSARCSRGRWARTLRNRDASPPGAARVADQRCGALAQLALQKSAAAPSSVQLARSRGHQAGARGSVRRAAASSAPPSGPKQQRSRSWSEHHDSNLGAGFMAGPAVRAWWRSSARACEAQARVSDHRTPQNAQRKGAPGPRA
jgi:hypothetical protein